MVTDTYTGIREQDLQEMHSGWVTACGCYIAAKAQSELAVMNITRPLGYPTM